MMKKQIAIALFGVNLLICAGGGKKHEESCWDSFECGYSCCTKEEIRRARLEKEKRDSEPSSSAAIAVTPFTIEQAMKKLCSEGRRAGR